MAYLLYMQFLKEVKRSRRSHSDAAVLTPSRMGAGEIDKQLYRSPLPVVCASSGTFFDRTRDHRRPIIATAGFGRFLDRDDIILLVWWDGRRMNLLAGVVRFGARMGCVHDALLVVDKYASSEMQSPLRTNVNSMNSSPRCAG
jgi:hypothetical protein